MIVLFAQLLTVQFDLENYTYSYPGQPLAINVPYMDIDYMQGAESVKRKRWMGKINFVEIRSFSHIFRSFDRMWGFFILSLQVGLCVFVVFLLPQSLFCLLFLWSFMWYSKFSAEGNDHYCMEWIRCTKFYIWGRSVQDSVEHFYNSFSIKTSSRWFCS